MKLEGNKTVGSEVCLLSHEFIHLFVFYSFSPAGVYVSSLDGADAQLMFITENS